MWRGVGQTSIPLPAKIISGAGKSDGQEDISARVDTDWSIFGSSGEVPVRVAYSCLIEIPIESEMVDAKRSKRHRAKIDQEIK